MIVVTGALGFIGSGFISMLNQLGYTHLTAVDDFYQWKKEQNLEGKRVHDFVHRDLFLHHFDKMAPMVEVVFHIGARTDTISTDEAIFNELNLNYTKGIWTICARHGIPMIYASSAATYGDGSLGFDDDHSKIGKLQPLNKYAHSKHDFDLWALEQNEAPPFWYGLKFFNVYGPNEYHKGRMASVVWHAVQQIREKGKLALFKSDHPDFEDGHQRRDFIYVRDVLQMMWDIYQAKPESGIYNVGTGQARTFADLGAAIFSAMHLEPDIEYIPMPDDLKGKYQYHTQAEMSKWKAANLPLPATSIEEGVKDYVRNYILTHAYL